MKRFINNLFILCMPLFILFILFSQIQSSKVIDLHNEISQTSGIRDNLNKDSSFNLAISFIPLIEPTIETLSLSNLFEDMNRVTNDYSSEASLNIFKDVEERYSNHLNNKGRPLYSYFYSKTLQNMITYFKNYNQFGQESDLTKLSKSKLQDSISIHQTISFMKYLTSILLLISSIVGFIIWRVKRINDELKE